MQTQHPRSTPRTAALVLGALLLILLGCADDPEVESTRGAPTAETATTADAPSPGTPLTADEIVRRAHEIAGESGDPEPDSIEWVRAASRNAATELIADTSLNSAEEDGPILVIGMTGTFTDAATRTPDPAMAEGEAEQPRSKAAVYFTIDETDGLLYDIVATNTVVDLAELGEVERAS